jgi:hypothetical protein
MAQYGSGHLLFVSGSTLMAQPFDVRSHRLSGAQVAIAEQVPSAITGYSSFSVSEAGVLAVAAFPGRVAKQLVWFDRSGKRVVEVGPAGVYDYPQLLRDGRIMYQRPGETGQNVWILDPPRRADFRVTEGSNAVPSPDGLAIVLNPGPRNRSQGIRRVGLTTSGAAEEILAGKIAWPNDWSSDGKLILFMHPEMSTKFDVSVLDVAHGNAVRPFVQTAANEGQARFSPDQHWVAYVSDESGRSEIYVRHFPDGNQQTIVSHGGGREPRWDRRGHSLFYLADDNSLMEANVEMSDDRIVMSAPRALFRAPVANGDVVALFGGSYAVADDGNRFLIAELVGENTGPRLNVILNWTSQLTRIP